MSLCLVVSFIYKANNHAWWLMMPVMEGTDQSNALLAPHACAGNLPVTNGSPHKGPIM